MSDHKEFESRSHSAENAQTRKESCAEDQSDVVRFLSDPTTHGGAEVKRIDTHCAAVFLAGDKAYKLKRAVRYPFLDYSSIEKRKRALDAELAINRDLAPSIYERVATIARGPGGELTLDGLGEVVDYVLIMRRFDDNATLDCVIAERALSKAEVDETARAIAAMHDRAARADATTWIADLESYIFQNEAAFIEHRDLLDSDSIISLTTQARLALERLKPILAKRGGFGLIRRCHGDLHLGNIAIIDGRPSPFDAIEFDERIASGDVLYDLAFVLMDLCERGHRCEANRLVNRYFAESHRIEDYEGLAALPFFLHMRAAIRAKTTLAKASFLATDQRSEVYAEARRYFNFALAMLQPLRPSLVAIGGLSGSGKTTLAYNIAPCIGLPPGAIVIRSDLVRKQLHHVGELDRLPTDDYSAAASAQVYSSMADRAHLALYAGASVVCDGVYARQDQRREIESVARETQVPFIGLWLDAAMGTRIERVVSRSGDASDADSRIVRAQERLDIGEMAWTPIDAQRTLDEMAAKALSCVRYWFPQEASENQEANRTE